MNIPNNEYICKYHIYQVEESTHTVYAESIHEALARCNMWLFNYSNGCSYEILSINLVDKQPQFE